MLSKPELDSIRLNLATGYVVQNLRDLKAQLQKTQRSLIGVEEILNKKAVNTDPDSTYIEVFDNDDDYIHIRILCFLALINDQGEIFCKQCQQTFLPGNLWLEKFERFTIYGPDVPLGSGGRRLYCRENHQLIDITDFRT